MYHKLHPIKARFFNPVSIDILGQIILCLGPSCALQDV